MAVESNKKNKLTNIDKELYLLFRNFRFSVDIDGAVLGFKSIKGIKIASSFEPLIEGGVNDGPIMLPVPNKDIGRITFERGKYTDKNNKLHTPGTPIKSLSITVFNDDETAKAEYILESPVIESIELGALDALSSDVLIETLTVMFKHITEK